MTQITESELYAEYERIKGKKQRIPLLTDEQYEYIKFFRQPEHCLTWDEIVDYFKERGWGDFVRTTLIHRYLAEKHQRH